MEDPLKIIPVNLGVKYSPPKIGLEYHLPNQPEIQLIYEVPLVSFVETRILTRDIVDQLFHEHRMYLHPRVIARSQIERLVERVLAKQRSINEKENSNKMNARRDQHLDFKPAPLSEAPVAAPVKMAAPAIRLEDAPDSERSAGPQDSNMKGFAAD